MSNHTRSRRKQNGIHSLRRLNLERCEDRRLLAGPSDAPSGNDSVDAVAVVSVSAASMSTRPIVLNSNMSLNADRVVVVEFTDLDVDVYVDGTSTRFQGGLSSGNGQGIVNGGGVRGRIEIEPAPESFGLDPDGHQTPDHISTKISEIESVVSDLASKSAQSQQSSESQLDKQLGIENEGKDQQFPNDVEIVRLATTEEILWQADGTILSRVAPNRAIINVAASDDASGIEERDDASFRYVATSSAGSSRVSNEYEVAYEAKNPTLVSVQHAEVSLVFETSGERDTSSTMTNAVDHPAEAGDVTQAEIILPLSSGAPVVASNHSSAQPVDPKQSNLSYAEFAGAPTVLLVAATLWTKTRTGTGSKDEKARNAELNVANLGER